VAIATLKEKAGKSGVESLEHSIYVPPSQPALQKAWVVTEALLVAMSDEARAHGVPLHIVMLANRPQVIPDRAMRAAFMQDLGVADLSYADQRIRTLGAREGIPVTVLATALSNYAEAHSVFLNGFNGASLGAGHWNEVGHRLAAETIASDLCGSGNRNTLPAIAVSH
jgi:hypothetical protein